MPKQVLAGFTTAAGFIIGLKQLNNAFGLRGLAKVGPANPFATWPFGMGICTVMGVTLCVMVVQKKTFLENLWVFRGIEEV